MTAAALSYTVKRIVGPTILLQSGSYFDLLNKEEEARIRELIAARTWPNKWDGTEPSGDAWLDRINSDGTVEPILFRELVGA